MRYVRRGDKIFAHTSITRLKLPFSNDAFEEMSALRRPLTLCCCCYGSRSCVQCTCAVDRSLKRKEQLCNDQTQYTGLADLGSIGTSSGPLIDEPPPLDVHSDDCAFPVKHHDSSEVASAVKNHPMFMKLVQAHYACRKVVQRTHKHQAKHLTFSSLSRTSMTTMNSSCLPALFIRIDNERFTDPCQHIDLIVVSVHSILSLAVQMIASDEQKKLIDNELMKVIASLSMLRGGDDESRLDDLFLAVGVEKKTVDEMFVEYCSAVENFSNEMQEPYTRAQSAFNELRTQLASITSTIGGTNTMQLMEDLRANPLFMNLTAYQKCDVMKEHFKRRYADSIARIADEFMSQKRSKKLPESAIEVLKLWWHEHIMWPYPEVRCMSHNAQPRRDPAPYSRAHICTQMHIFLIHQSLTANVLDRQRAGRG